MAADTRALSAAIKRTAPNLRAQGVELADLGKNRDGRRIRLTLGERPRMPDIGPPGPPPADTYEQDERRAITDEGEEPMTA